MTYVGLLSVHFTMILKYFALILCILKTLFVSLLFKALIDIMPINKKFNGYHR